MRLRKIAIQNGVRLFVLPSSHSRTQKGVQKNYNRNDWVDHVIFYHYAKNMVPEENKRNCRFGFYISQESINNHYSYLHSSFFSAFSTSFVAPKLCMMVEDDMIYMFIFVLKKIMAYFLCYSRWEHGSINMGGSGSWGSMECWRLNQDHVPHDGGCRRWQAITQARWSLGRSPNSAVSYGASRWWTSVFFRSAQSVGVIEFSLARERQWQGHKGNFCVLLGSSLLLWRNNCPLYPHNCLKKEV